MDYCHHLTIFILSKNFLNSKFIASLLILYHILFDPNSFYIKPEFEMEWKNAFFQNKSLSLWLILRLIDFDHSNSRTQQQKKKTISLNAKRPFLNL